MKKVLFILIVVCMISTSAFAAVDYKELQKPEALTDQFSYAYGLLLANSLRQNYPEINTDYLAKGIYDMYGDDAWFYSVDEVNEILRTYQLKIIEENNKIAAENLSIAESFLAENKKNPAVKVTSTGLQYEVIKEGKGQTPKASSNVNVDYQLTLLDGTLIDSSYVRKVPSDFPLTQVIPGFREGLTLMKVGSHYRFWIHPDIGYGANSTNVPPNSLLIFEVELHAINQ